MVSRLYSYRNQQQILPDITRYYKNFSMQIVAPLLSLSFQMFHNFLQPQLPAPRPETPPKKIFPLKNKKILAEWQIQEVKKLITAQDKSVIKGRKATNLKRNDRKRLLLLDLDQTLIYAKGTNGIQLRPYVQEFLEQVHSHFRIFIFTAASRQYTFLILNKFKAQLDKIQGVLDKSHCTSILKQNEGHKIYVKELSIIDAYQPHEIVIIDDTPVTYCMNRKNSIGIQPFYGDKGDTQFEKLKSYFTNAHQKADIRQFLAEKPYYFYRY